MTQFLVNREIYERVVRDAVPRGAFCRDCGRREYCGDPVLDDAMVEVC